MMILSSFSKENGRAYIKIALIIQFVSTLRIDCELFFKNWIDLTPNREAWV